MVRYMVPVSEDVSKQLGLHCFSLLTNKQVIFSAYCHLAYNADMGLNFSWENFISYFSNIVFLVSIKPFMD